MSDLLNSLMNETTGTTGVRILAQEHDTSRINFVRGMTDPGEMIRCGYRQDLRRLAGENDADYAQRIYPLVMALPQAERDVIMQAAVRRASLDTTGGKVSAAFALTPPWHGLGTVVSGAMSSSEALTLANLGWKVSKTPLSYSWHGEQRPIDGGFAVVRDDNGAHLGTVGSRYVPVQNEDGFAFLDSVLSQYGATYESAGALSGGSEVWMLAHLPRQAVHVNGDQIEPYILFTNRHDGTASALCYPTTVRVECANTLRTAGSQRNGKGISLRHTGNIREKVRSAQRALGIACDSFATFGARAEALVSKPADVKTFTTGVLDSIFQETEAELREKLKITLSGPERDLLDAAWERQQDKRRAILEDVMTRYESGRCHPQGTAWAAFNAVSEYADHNTLGRQASDPYARLASRFKSAMIGERDEIKQVAFQQALAL